jgi:hypothetical protein
MINQVGIGVFGTFGEPHGYQQAFYSGVGFNESLDLDDSAIEFYPGAELYAVKRELIGGVYTVCFCTYSYVRELNTERFGTFLGTCVVLRNSYAEADYIYKALRTLHEATIKNVHNVDNGILKPLQVQDIAILEPADFVALNANIIPISKTPFFSAYVDAGRQQLITPSELIADDKHSIVTSFFDEALKNYNDTGSLYFSFDENVSEFVSKEGKIAVTVWEDYINRKPQGAEPTVVRTKKGIHKPAGLAAEASFASSNLSASVDKPTHDAYPEKVSPDNEDPADEAENTYEDDNTYEDEYDEYKPFDLWEDPIPENGWSKEEVKHRAKEYNRLFKYTNTLIEHMNQPGNKKQKQKTKKVTEEKPYTEPTNGSKRKKRILLLLAIVLLITASIAAYTIITGKNNKQTVSTPSPSTVQQPDPFDENAAADSSLRVGPAQTEDTALSTTPASQVAATTPTKNADEEVAPMQPVAKVSPQAAAVPKQAATVSEPQKTATITFTKEEATAPNTGNQTLMTAAAPMYHKSKELRPRPNLEMNQNDVTFLKETGIKNKTPSEITRILFDNVPSNIGNIYRGQEEHFAAAIYNLNKQLFQKSGNDYICTTNDMTLRIPAYKSPRLPVVYPK